MTNPIPRQKARKYAVQAIYQWQMSAKDLDEIEKQFLKHDIKDLSKVDLVYFKELLHGVPKHLATIDASMEPYVTRKIADIDPVELAVLRLALYELAYRLDIPYKVVINEALNLTKTFGSEEGYKFVNSILDQVANALRVDET